MCDERTRLRRQWNLTILGQDIAPASALGPGDGACGGLTHLRPGHPRMRTMDAQDRDDARQGAAARARDPGDVSRTRDDRHRDGRRAPRHGPGAPPPRRPALPARPAAAHRAAHRSRRDPHLPPAPRSLRPALAAPVPARHAGRRAGRGRSLAALARVQGHLRGGTGAASAGGAAGGGGHGREAPRDPPPAGGPHPEPRLRDLGVAQRVLRRRHGVLLGASPTCGRSGSTSRCCRSPASARSCPSSST